MVQFCKPRPGITHCVQQCTSRSLIYCSTALTQLNTTDRQRESLLQSKLAAHESHLGVRIERAFLRLCWIFVLFQFSTGPSLLPHWYSSHSSVLKHTWRITGLRGGGFLLLNFCLPASIHMNAIRMLLRRERVSSDAPGKSAALQCWVVGFSSTSVLGLVDQSTSFSYIARTRVMPLSFSWT